MNEKYDLSAMLKEIEEDMKLEPEARNEQISQDAITMMLKKKKGGKDEK